MKDGELGLFFQYYEANGTQHCVLAGLFAFFRNNGVANSTPGFRIALASNL